MKYSRIANLREAQADLGDTEGLKAEIARLENERDVAAELVRRLIDQNARVAQNQEDYRQRYDEIFARYEAAEKALTAAQGSLHQKEKQTEQIESFTAEVKALPGHGSWQGFFLFTRNCSAPYSLRPASTRSQSFRARVTSAQGHGCAHL